jgi:hypothetical protein
MTDYFFRQPCKHDCNCPSQLALPFVAMRHWLCDDLHTATHALPCAAADVIVVLNPAVAAKIAATTAAAAIAEPREPANFGGPNLWGIIVSLGVRRAQAPNTNNKTNRGVAVLDTRSTA